MVIDFIHGISMGIDFYQLALNPDNLNLKPENVRCIIQPYPIRNNTLRFNKTNFTRGKLHTRLVFLSLNFLN